jgi:hypothetical protein
MSVSDELRALIDSNAPLWAGEAEVIRAYWASPIRTRQTDLRWLRYQCRKEFWDSFADTEKGLYLEPLDRLRAAFPKIDIEVPRQEILATARAFVEEFTHYCAFADVYDAIRGPGDPKIDPHRLREMGDLPENAALSALRAEHRRSHGELGYHACEITEGGYCGLFAEGVKLEGRGGVDDLIARACRVVYEDEFEHMLKGIVGLDEENLRPRDWQQLRQMTNDQMRLRIRMRNAQFSHPLPEERIQAIFGGRIEPVAFDYERAGLGAHAAH